MRVLHTMCYNAELPGKDFVTKPFTMYGVPRKMPSHINFTDFFSLDFYCTGWMRERIFFDKWQSFIANPTNFYFEYFDKYKADIDITTFTDDGVPNYAIRVEEAYPVMVLSQPLSYQKADVLTLSVKFAYRRWRNMTDVYNEGTVSNGVVDRTGGGSPATPVSEWPGAPMGNPVYPQDITSQAQVTNAATNNTQQVLDQVLNSLGLGNSTQPPPATVGIPAPLEGPHATYTPPRQDNPFIASGEVINSIPPPGQSGGFSSSSSSSSTSPERSTYGWFTNLFK